MNITTLKMDITTLKNIEDLHVIFRCYRSYNGLGHLFRGETNADWQLIPKAGRKEYFLQYNRDLNRFKSWEHEAIAFDYCSTNILEGLAIAQHHGLATRLLDWSQNPLVASYFAVHSNNEIDGAIYILEALELFTGTDFSMEAMKAKNDVYCYKPRAITSRVINQRGMFTVHCPANKEIKIVKSRFDHTQSNLLKVIIPHTLKNEILQMLDDYGINELTLFPGLDGLSRYKNWESHKNIVTKHLS